MSTEKMIVSALRNLGVEATVTETQHGAAVDRFILTPGPGVRVQQISRAESDLQVALGVESVRVSSNGALTIELPSQDRQVVPLSTLAATLDADHPLRVPVGLSVDGSGVSARLDRLPHLLVAGTTGSGKSQWLSAILTHLITHADPAQVQIDLLDPKRVELSIFRNAPHVRGVATEIDDMIEVLTETVAEMEDRYRALEIEGARNVEELSSSIPYRLVVIDELADALLVSRKAIETPLVRLLQLGRAAGIHVIIGTQRPSADVITGLIRANVPSRLTFAVQSHQDSSIALGTTGAERLLGRGDALWSPSGAPNPVRIQGPYIATEDVQQAVAESVADQPPPCRITLPTYASAAATLPPPAQPAPTTTIEDAYAMGHATGLDDARTDRPSGYGQSVAPSPGAPDRAYLDHAFITGYGDGYDSLAPTPDQAHHLGFTRGLEHRPEPVRRVVRSRDLWLGIGAGIAALAVAAVALPLAPIVVGTFVAVAVVRRRTMVTA